MMDSGDVDDQFWDGRLPCTSFASVNETHGALRTSEGFVFPSIGGGSKRTIVDLENVKDLSRPHPNLLCVPKEKIFLLYPYFTMGEGLKYQAIDFPPTLFENFLVTSKVKPMKSQSMHPMEKVENRKASYTLITKKRVFKFPPPPPQVKKVLIQSKNWEGKPPRISDFQSLNFSTMPKQKQNVLKTKVGKPFSEIENSQLLLLVDKFKDPSSQFVNWDNVHSAFDEGCRTKLSLRHRYHRMNDSKKISCNPLPKVVKKHNQRNRPTISSSEKYRKPPWWNSKIEDMSQCCPVSVSEDSKSLESNNWFNITLHESNSGKQPLSTIDLEKNFKGKKKMAKKKFNKSISNARKKTTKGNGKKVTPKDEALPSNRKVTPGDEVLAPNLVGDEALPPNSDTVLAPNSDEALPTNTVESPPPPVHTIAMKIRIVPNRQQVAELENLFDGVRWLYNTAVLYWNLHVQHDYEVVPRDTADRIRQEAKIKWEDALDAKAKDPVTAQEKRQRNRETKLVNTSKIVPNPNKEKEVLIPKALKEQQYPMPISGFDLRDILTNPNSCPLPDAAPFVLLKKYQHPTPTIDLIPNILKYTAINDFLNAKNTAFTLQKNKADAVACKEAAKAARQYGQNLTKEQVKQMFPVEEYKCEATVKSFSMSCKSKNSRKKSMKISKGSCSWTEQGVTIFPKRKIGCLRFHDAKNAVKLLEQGKIETDIKPKNGQNNIEKECQILLDRGRYYVIILKDISSIPTNVNPTDIPDNVSSSLNMVKPLDLVTNSSQLDVMQDNVMPTCPPRKDWIALDPGVRTFQYGYDSSGSTVEIGDGAASVLFLKCKKQDYYRAQLAKHKKPQYDTKDERKREKSERRRLRKLITKIQFKKENLVRHMHIKTCKFLTSNYEQVILPSFDVSKLIKRRGKTRPPTLANIIIPNQGDISSSNNIIINTSSNNTIINTSVDLGKTSLKKRKNIYHNKPSKKVKKNIQGSSSSNGSSSSDNTASSSSSNKNTTAPSLNGSSSGSSGRVIGRKTVRQMLALSHYKFKQRLKTIAASKNCTVHIVTEEYTSKGCGRCGKIHEKLGGQKWFTCPYESCGFSVPRDLNGARNIFLKNSVS